MTTEFDQVAQTSREQSPGTQGLSPAAALPAGTAGKDGESGDIELSIVMPCLDEARTLGTCIEKASSFIQAYGISGEIIVSDNGSKDGSQQIAVDAGARVVDAPTKGYGAAITAGILAARGRFVIVGDSDGSYDFSHLEAFVDELRDGKDLVIGNRFEGGISAGAMPFLHRYLGNPVLSMIGRLFFRSNVRDFHCGLRGISKEAFSKLDIQTTGMEFASEMVVKAVLRGMMISEVPTTLSPDGRDRAPHLRTWRDGWRHLRFLLMYAPRWLFLYPGLVLMGVGLFAMMAILPGPLQLGSIVFDVHTLVVAMGAIVVGGQVTLFYLLAQRYAVTTGLLPETSSSRVIQPYMRLEFVVVLGSALFVTGTAGLIYAVYLWSITSFSQLNYSWMMRLVVPSVATMAFGVQAVFAGFLGSILDLKVNSVPKPGPDS